MRALFDSGAEINVIAESVVKSLKLKRNLHATIFHGITGDEQFSNRAVNVQMSPWFDTANKTTIFKSFIVLKSIPVIQKQSFDNNIVEFVNIVKADPNYNRPARIDMILGAKCGQKLCRRK